MSTPSSRALVEMTPHENGLELTLISHCLGQIQDFFFQKNLSRLIWVRFDTVDVQDEESFDGFGSGGDAA